MLTLYVKDTHYKVCCSCRTRKIGAIFFDDTINYEVYVERVTLISQEIWEHAHDVRARILPSVAIVS
jgi:hypothetical protein